MKITAFNPALTNKFTNHNTKIAFGDKELYYDDEPRYKGYRTKKQEAERERTRSEEYRRAEQEEKSREGTYLVLMPMFMAALGTILWFSEPKQNNPQISTEVLKDTISNMIDEIDTNQNGLISAKEIKNFNQDLIGSK